LSYSHINIYDNFIGINNPIGADYLMITVKEIEMFKRLIVPLDGSKLAETALPYAEELARHLGTEVILVNVRTPIEQVEKPELREYLSAMAGTTAQNIKKSLDKPRGEKVKVTSAVIGMPGLLKHPAEDIAEYAEKEKVGLIVMATHGRTGIKRFALGNTADKVARISKSPVLLIRANAKAPKSLHMDNILVPLDGSLISESSLSYVEYLAANLKTKVSLLYVVEMLYHIYAAPSPLGYYGADSVVKIPYNDEELKPMKEAGEKYIKGVSAKLADKGIKTTYEVRVGSAGQEIIEAEGETHPDLVVMSTHGHGGFGRFDYGSVTDKVLHSGITPLLLVRPKKEK
jgi:nucleotide-binding universal stress UspA family protein